MNLKSNSNIMYVCSYYVVFYSKYRRIMLASGVDGCLKEIVLAVTVDIASDVLKAKSAS